MCSQFTSPKNPKAIEKSLGTKIEQSQLDFEWGKEIRFHTQTPVVMKDKSGKLKLEMRTFPVSPMPNARMSGLKGQTDGNDKGDIDERQIERIYEKPLWKHGFEHDPLVIPMASFKEFAYWGPEIGSALAFKVPSEEVLFAAGFGIKTFTPAGPQGTGVSLITHVADDEMIMHHFRRICILPAAKVSEYLSAMSGQERFDCLSNHIYTGPLEYGVERAMAKGWEKRIEAQTQKLERELTYRETLKKEGVTA